MALTDYEAAKTQYLENLVWRADRAKAILLLEAIDALILLRMTSGSDGDGGAISFEALQPMKEKLETFITNSTVADTVSGKRITQTLAEF